MGGGSIIPGMKNVHWLGRTLLLGFVWVFAFGFAYLLMDSLGVWKTLPPAVTRTIDLMTGAVLAAELVGHLVLTTGRLPTASPPPKL
jgi:hypothetical protein